MKKYVRTKSNKIYEIEKLIARSKMLPGVNEEEIAIISLAANENRENMLGWQRRIVKEADSIHELVDAYWWENINYKDPIYTPTYWHAEERLKAWLESDLKLGADNLKEITVYGSIYVKGEGWHHVSKLSIDKNGEIKEELI